MNKMMKGSIAGATGIALLMGGFGTYALWSDSEDLAGSSITSGTLDVSAGAVAWKDQNNATWALGTDKIVPGDTVTRTQSFTFTATGRNMRGTIKFTPGSKTEQSNAATTSPASAKDDFTVAASVSGLTLTESAPGSNCWTFTASSLNQTATTSVVYTLTADSQDLQNVAASIAGSSFSIQQGSTCP